MPCLTSDAGARQKQMLHWLSPIGPEASHEAAVCAHHGRTGDWFIRSPEFLDWLGKGNPCLWLSGFPGSGKTILFSTVVEHIRQLIHRRATDLRMAYFYFDFRRTDSQEPINAVGSLIAQLCTQAAWFPPELEALYDQSITSTGQSRRPTLSELSDVLARMASAIPIAILLDGLDECTEEGEISGFISMVTHFKPPVRALVSSREHWNIRRYLQSAAKIDIYAHPDQISSDIQAYIYHRLENDERLYWLNPAIKVDIRNELTNRSHGMYVRNFDLLVESANRLGFDGCNVKSIKLPN
jgi:NACHT domain